MVHITLDKVSEAQLKNACYWAMHYLATGNKKMFITLAPNEYICALANTVSVSNVGGVVLGEFSLKGRHKTLTLELSEVARGDIGVILESVRVMGIEQTMKEWEEYARSN